MRILSFAFTVFTVLILIGVSGFLYGYSQYTRSGALEQEILFMVERGQGVSVIATNLEQKGVIDNVVLFKIATRLAGKHTGLKAGEYRFEPHISMQDVIAKLEEGDVYRRQFTVPEGYTSWQIVNILNNIDDLTGDITDIPAEGSLMPDTYQYRLGDSRAAIIRHMQEAMDKAIETVLADKAEDAPLLSQAELVILASIIEKETGKPEERRAVAGVFHNRLKRGMPLQTDPTVIYAITKGKIEEKGRGPLGRRLLRTDLQFESPYNTYKYAGLPPGPIANPGRASLAAALNPEKHDYIYFVADGTGGHIFARTLAEHNKNAAEWRKIRQEQGN